MKRQQAQLAEITTAMPMTRDCVSDIRNIIVLARRSVVCHINTTMALAYWLIGRRIVVEEQKGSKRAAYGERLLERISRELSSEFGNGFGEPHLRNCRLFYKAYPTESEIRYALRIKLTWTHHRAIMRVHEQKARAYFYNYILRCFVLVDLKTAKLTSRDIGQMDAYRRMFDTLKRQPSDQQTIGILLGTEIDEPEVKYSIMAECERIFATKLMPFLPTKAELQCEIERSYRRTNLKKRSDKPTRPAIGRS